MKTFYVTFNRHISQPYETVQILAFDTVHAEENEIVMRKYSERELEELYCEYLDEAFGTVKIGEYEYDTSQALRNVDKVAFNCGFSDWLNSELGKTLEEVDGEYFEKERN